jgi:hypothetical protein
MHTEPLSKLVILTMDGYPPIICLKCGSYLVWSTQPHLVYRTPTCVCHTEEQLVSPCHKSFARQTVLTSVAPLHEAWTAILLFPVAWDLVWASRIRRPRRIRCRCRLGLIAHSRCVRADKFSFGSESVRVGSVLRSGFRGLDRMDSTSRGRRRQRRRLRAVFAGSSRFLLPGLCTLARPEHVSASDRRSSVS